jgi:hypothetical protein
MLKIKNFLSLETKNRLSLEDKKKIFSVFEKNNLKKLILPLQVYKDNVFKFVSFFVRKNKEKNTYLTRINLYRDLSREEFEKIREDLYKSIPDLISVSFSSQIKRTEKNKIKKNNKIFNNIVEIISKKYHNNYIIKKTNKNWRYGNKYSYGNKTDPFLLPWEQLTEKKKRKLKKIVGFVLNELGKIKK